MFSFTGEGRKGREWGIFQCPPINFYFVPFLYLPKNLESIVPFRIAVYRDAYGKFFTRFLCPKGKETVTGSSKYLFKLLLKEVL